MKTLVLGIGNPIMSDDGVGFHVAQALAGKIKDENIDVEDISTSGLNLLEIIIEYDKVVIIDAVMRGEKVGKIYKLYPEDFSETVHLTGSMHEVNLPTVIKIGNELMPEKMPKEIVIYAIEVKTVDVFSEEMTKEVEKTVPLVVDRVLDEIK